jgi:hypothetical protein
MCDGDVIKLCRFLPRVECAYDVIRPHGDVELPYRNITRESWSAGETIFSNR